MIIRDEDLVAFLKWALPKLGRRWSGYRKVRGQVKGRLKERLAELGMEDLDEYRSLLEEHPEEWAVLDDYFRITISRFYRGRATFDALRKEVLPALAKNASQTGRNVLKAWCIGSASGEEAYTLRLCWNLDVGRDFPSLELEILGTDAGAHMIERARRACYPEGSLKELPEDWVERAFEKTEDVYDPLCLCDAFRRGVEFRLQDVRHEQPDGPFDLVLADPPYSSGAKGLITDMSRRATLLLGADARIVVEHSRHEQVEQDAGQIRITDQRRFGDTMLSFYSYEKETE